MASLAENVSAAQVRQDGTGWGDPPCNAASLKEEFTGLPVNITVRSISEWRPESKAKRSVVTADLRGEGVQLSAKRRSMSGTATGSKVVAGKLCQTLTAALVLLEALDGASRFRQIKGFLKSPRLQTPNEVLEPSGRGS
jgi:hypothetical protein